MSFLFVAWLVGPAVVFIEGSVATPDCDLRGAGGVRSAGDMTDVSRGAGGGAVSRGAGGGAVSRGAGGVLSAGDMTDVSRGAGGVRSAGDMTDVSRGAGGVRSAGDMTDVSRGAGWELC